MQIRDRLFVVTHIPRSYSWTRQRQSEDRATPTRNRQSLRVDTVTARRVVVDRIDRRVRFLSQAQRTVIGSTMARCVYSVSKQNHRLASRDRSQLFLEDRLNCVVEPCSTAGTRATNRFGDLGPIPS